MGLHNKRVVTAGGKEFKGAEASPLLRKAGLRVMGRKGLPKHALEEARLKGVRELELAIVHQQGTSNVNGPVHVICMHMSEDDGADVRR